MFGVEYFDVEVCRLCYCFGKWVVVGREEWGIGCGGFDGGLEGICDWEEGLEGVYWYGFLGR